MTPDVVERISIRATPEQVYRVVSDVAGMGRFSPEATGARGVAGSAQVGDRFTGTNRNGLARWSTTCTVTVADPGSAFEFDVAFGPFPISIWRYDIAPDGDAVTLTESWTDRRTGAAGAVMKLAGQFVIPGRRPGHNRANMQVTLQRMKAELEGTDQA